MSLSERLKTARESRGYSQKYIAMEIGTNTQTWQVYESGKSIPGGKVFEALSRMGFNVNWLLTGEGEMLLKKWPVKVTKEVSDMFGRAGKPIVFEVDELFGARIYNELKGRTSEWLASESNIELERLKNIIYKEEVPTAEEIISIADSLKLNPRWLSEKSNFEGEDDKHKRTAKTFFRVRNIEEDEKLMKSIGDKLNSLSDKYGFNIPEDKKVIVIMIMFNIFKTDVEEHKEELFDQVADRLMRLCRPIVNQESA